jgi:hypothetical protein
MNTLHMQLTAPTGDGEGSLASSVQKEGVELNTAAASGTR